MYEIDYINENEFRRLERALKKYNMRAYKEYFFIYRPKLQAGDFSDAVLNENVYEIGLKTDKMFEKVYGPCKLIFKVIDKTVILLEITPRDILLEEHNSELSAYKGVLVSKYSEYDKDLFKIDLLKMYNGLGHKDR